MRACTSILLAVSVKALLVGCAAGQKPRETGVVKPDAKVKKLKGGFRFTEGPACDKEGNVYFTDIPNNRIHKWSTDGKVSTFLENSGGANGLFFDFDGDLLACAGGEGELVSITKEGKVTTLVSEYQGKRLNSPNDLWLHPKGGIYFTDPRYGNRDNLPQDGEHVYYLSPNRERVVRVISDMVRPNGVIGTPDGKKLYVADHGAGKTYEYNINADGTLSDKTLFVNQGSDGLTMDARGDLYLTSKEVFVYSPKGEEIAVIEVPERPANVCFAGKDRRTLFITARTSIYAVKMQLRGARYRKAGNAP